MKMASMELDDEQKIDYCAPVECPKPDYPYGLRISFCKAELDKLGCKAEDFQVGDVIDMRSFGCVTSVSSNQMADGTDDCRIEIQIQRLGIENENTETEMEVAEEAKPARRRGLYDRMRG
jgi:hypothetical protein